MLRHVAAAFSIFSLRYVEPPLRRLRASASELMSRGVTASAFRLSLSDLHAWRCSLMVDTRFDVTVRAPPLSLAHDIIGCAARNKSIRQAMPPVIACATRVFLPAYAAAFYCYRFRIRHFELYAIRAPVVRLPHVS